MLDRVFELVSVAVVVAVAVAVVTAVVHVVVGLFTGSWCSVAGGSASEIRIDLVLVLIGMALFSLLISLAEYILERAHRAG